MANFFDKINTLFKCLLIKHNLLETRRSFDKQNFGNALLTLSSKSLHFIFTRDRDFESAGISATSDPKEEFDLQVVRAYILSHSIEGEYLRPVKLDALAKFVENNYDKIEEAFSKKQYPKTKKYLKKLQEMRYKKLMGK